MTLQAVADTDYNMMDERYNYIHDDEDYDMMDKFYQ
jgi:hypothetical protein